MPDLRGGGRYRRSRADGGGRDAPETECALTNPARKGIGKAPAQKARRGVFAFGLQGQAREADPSYCFLEGKSGPRRSWCDRLRRGCWTALQFWSTDPSPASAPLPAGQGLRQARPGAKSRRDLPSQRQAVLAVVLHEGALPASLRDSQLSGAFGTLGLLHDLLAKLVIAGLLAETGQRLSHVLRFHFLAPGGCGEGARPAAEKHNVCGSSWSSRGCGGAA